MDSGKEKIGEEMNFDDCESVPARNSKIISAYLERIELTADLTAEAVLFVDSGEREYSAQIFLPADLLPKGASDGDYLKIEISQDEEKTKAELEKARRLLNDLEE